MGTAVAIRGFGGGERLQAYGRNIAQQAQFGGMDDGGLPILSLDKDEGFWRFGEDNTELDEKDLLAVNPISFVHGYVAFGKEGLAETLDGDKAEVMVPADGPLPHRDTLPELELVKLKRGEEAREPSWQLCMGVQMVIIEGPNEGTTVIYKPMSKGGQRMVRKLMAEIGRRLEDGREDCVPLIEVWSEDYKHRTYGKIFNPLFEVVEWTTAEDDGSERPAAKVNGKKAGPAIESKTKKPVDEDERRPARGTRTTRGRDVEETEAEEVEDEKPARGSRRGGDVAKEPAKPARSARGRDRDDEEVEEVEEERGSRRSARGGRDKVDEPKSDSRRSTRRARDDVEEEEAPRTRRGARDADEDAGEAVRGRRASAGRRSR